MPPAALLARGWPYLAKRFPEAQRAVADGELRGVSQPALPQLQHQAGPRLSAFTKPIGEADQLLVTLWRRTNEHQNALRVVFQARLQMNAVGPDIDVPLGRQVALLPGFVLVLCARRPRCP